MKKLKLFKLFIAAFMMLSLLITGCLFPISAADGITSADGSLVISNDKVSLSVNTENGAITLTNLATLQKYYSTPVNIEEEGIVDGLGRARALSQLMLDIVDKKGVASTVNSNIGISDAKFTQKGDSIIVKYVFGEEGIELNVVYTLKNSSFVATIPLDSIKEKGDYSLVKVSLLPYFAAADRDKTGYILVPDGSGALINFNNGKATTLYSSKVYGTDPITNRDTMIVNTQNVLLPILGIHSDKTAENAGSNILMYIEDGAAAGMVNALPSTASNSFNYAYMSFIYRSSTFITMLENTQFPVSATMLANNRATCESFSVSYNVLAENGDYNEMAEFTRNKLLADGLTADKITDKVYIDAYMSVKKTKHFLGIPYKANETLTTFDECLKLIEKLDGNTAIILHGLDKDGAVGGVIDTKFTVNSKLGGIKGYKNFVKNLEKLDSDVFPVAEFINFNKSKWGYHTSWNDARAVNFASIEKLYYLYGNYQENKNYQSLRYLIPTKILKAANSYISSLEKSGINSAAPLSIGNTPYSSCDGNGCDIVSVTDNYTEILKSMKKNGTAIALQSPAAYALNYTDYAFGMPLRSSGFTCFDMDIPFVQLVLNGVKNYSTPAINLTNNIPQMKLLMLESGSAPYYTIIGKEYKDVKDTPLDILYGAELDALEDGIIKDCNEYREFFKKTNCEIKKHITVTKDLRVVEFKNGTKIIINYADASADYNGVTVEAMSYKIIEGGVSNE